MTTGLSNASKRARFYSETTNQPQGGGSKKAGLQGTVGHGWHYSDYLKQHQTTRDLRLLRITYNPSNLSRPVGSWTNGNVYWNLF